MGDLVQQSTQFRRVGSDGIDQKFAAYLDFSGKSAPAVSAAGEGRIYFDSTANTMKISENGAAYKDIAAVADLSTAVLLAGRSGTGNNFIISSDSDGTMTGSGVSNGSLTIEANSVVGTTGTIFFNLRRGLTHAYVSETAGGSLSVGVGGITNAMVAGRKAGNVFYKFFCENQNAGTIATAGYEMKASTGTGSIEVTSGGFTESGDNLQNQVRIRAYSTADGGINMRTESASSIYLGTDSLTRVEVDPTGNVGIGGSPTEEFEVIKNQNAVTVSQVTNTDTGSLASCGFYARAESSKIIGILAAHSGTFTSDGAGQEADTVSVRGAGTDLAGMNFLLSGAKPFKWKHDTTELATITSDGLGVKATPSASWPLWVDGSRDADSGIRHENTNVHASARSSVMANSDTISVGVQALSSIYSGTGFAADVGSIRCNKALTFNLGVSHTEYARFLVTGEFLVGTSAVLTADNQVSVYNQQNSATVLEVRNDDLGTLCQSGFRIGNGTDSATIAFTGTGYTPVQEIVANSMYLGCSAGSGGVLIRNADDAPIRFGLSGSEIARFETTGLTLDTATGTGQFQGKVDGLAHGMTVIQDTDAAYTFGTTSSQGGLNINVIRDSASLPNAIALNGALATGTPNSTKSTAGRALVEVRGLVKSGSTWAAAPANSNTFAVGSFNTIEFLVDREGDTWQAGGGGFGVASNSTWHVNSALSSNATTGILHTNSNVGASARGSITASSASVSGGIQATSAAYSVGGDGYAADVVAVSSSKALTFNTGATAVEAGRFLTTGEFLVGGTAVDEGGFVEVNKNQDANTILAVINKNTGTAASATASFSNSAHQSTIGMTSTGFTPSLGRLADQFVIRAAGATAGGLFLTTGSGATNHLIFGSNDTERARILATGEFLVNRTTLFNAGDIAEFGKDTNGVGRVTVVNETSDTAAEALLEVHSNSAGGNLRATSSAYTPAAGLEADSVYFYANTNVSGEMGFVTGTTTKIAFKTNATDRWEIDANNGNLQAQDDVLIQRDVNAGLTASTTQTQVGGLALTAEINEVSTVANANDTVVLPSAVAGLRITVINNGANTLQIFPASGDDLGAGVDTATTLAAGSKVMYEAWDATNWA